MAELPRHKIIGCGQLTFADLMPGSDSDLASCLFSSAANTTRRNARSEVDHLRRLVYELSWDSPFGMWTRNAFLQHCRLLASGVYQLIFFDLDDIGELNLRFGYAEVDQRINTTFSILRGTNHIVARWYSGDEIIIMLSEGIDPKAVIRPLVEAGSETGISFVFAHGGWNAAVESIEAAVQALSNQACCFKLQRHATGGA